MSKFMMIIGILFAAIGLALGLMIFFATSGIVGWGITPEVAAILLVGGTLAAGLGGVIQSVEHAAAAPHMVVAEPQAPVRSETVIPEFGRRSTEAAVATMTPAVRETIAALEEAKTNIRQALGEETAASPPPPPPPEPPAEPVATASAETAPVEEPAPVEEVQEPVEQEPQLYVVEERVIRNREARILSDGTVEAETDEGWMRFENLEHLDEYLDAMEEVARA